MAKHKVEIEKVSRPNWNEDGARRAEGKVNGVPFGAYQYRDHHALQGAQPLRWKVFASGGKRKLTLGERIAVARALKKKEGW